MSLPDAGDAIPSIHRPNPTNSRLTPTPSQTARRFMDEGEQNSYEHPNPKTAQPKKFALFNETDIHLQKGHRSTWDRLN